MNELISVQHFETDQAQQPLESAVVSFCDKLDRSQNTKKAYGRDLRHFSQFASGVEVGDLSQLTPDLIVKYLQYCKDQNLSNSTIWRRSASLSSFLQYSGMQEFAKTARDFITEHIGYKSEIQPLHPLSNKEIKKLQEVTKGNSRDAAYIAIALGTGANVSKILALRSDSIVEADGQVFVQFKGKHERTAKLDSEASEIVRRHKGNSDGEEPLFARGTSIKERNLGLSRATIWHRIKQLGGQIGRPDINPKVLRQTYLVNAQTNDKNELANLLGMDVDSANRIIERRRLTERLFPRSGVLFERTA